MSAVGRHRLLVAVAAVVILIGAVIVSRDLRSGSASGKNAATQTASSSAASATSAATGYPGMPPVVDPANVYSEIGPGRLRPELAGDIARVYVPNGLSNTVSVIDPSTHAVVNSFKTDREPQHIVPSFDMRTLWVLDDQGNTVIPINPVDGTPGKPVPVEDPYNLYFTPDGSAGHRRCRGTAVVSTSATRTPWHSPRRCLCPGATASTTPTTTPTAAISSSPASSQGSWSRSTSSTGECSDRSTSARSTCRANPTPLRCRCRTAVRPHRCRRMCVSVPTAGTSTWPT